VNITHETETKIFNKKELEVFVNQHFKGVCNYDSVTNIVYICDNKIMTDPKFIEMLNTWKVYIQPSLF